MIDAHSTKINLIIEKCVAYFKVRVAGVKMPKEVGLIIKQNKSFFLSVSAARSCFFRIEIFSAFNGIAL